MTTFLTYEEIRTIASKEGLALWHRFVPNESELLMDLCLNRGSAWMFFKHPSIVLPDGYALADCAIVVSRRGTAAQVADFSPNFDKCMEYLLEMSDHFEKHNE